jgi:amidophosphoribosyltransferase
MGAEMTLYDDRPREECGVFGIFGSAEAWRMTYCGLMALQHRGQESAGIAVADGSRIRLKKGMGLVSDVFSPAETQSFSGHIALGHVRYSTTGTSMLSNAQPLLVKHRLGQLALAHNGNLTNAYERRRQLEEEGSIFQTTSDTEVIAHLVAKSRCRSFEDSVVDALRRVEGAYALVAMSGDTLVGARDPFGIRPLSLGRLNGMWVLASETCALDAMGAEHLRDIEPGEVVFVDQNGLRSVQATEKQGNALCIFEYIYFARPDSDLEGLNVHAVRKDLGRRLARLFPVEADLVTGVPDSSVSAASGFAEEARTPYEMGLVKNRYIGRTFIQPAQATREFDVKLKLNPLKRVIKGKRVVLVDDSIVRGTTMRHIVHLLRDAGAAEVHVRISSPPYRSSCHYGIDTSSSRELIASTKEVEHIRKHIEADTLHYLPIEQLLEAVGSATVGHCLACFTGQYPVRVPEGTVKNVFEGSGDDGSR